MTFNFVFGAVLMQVESVIEFEPGLDSFIDQLLEVKNAQSRVYVMYAG
jgi:ionotropic glutamate receptor NMDA 1